MKRTRPRNMSARKLARFRSENAGAYPRSSITPKKEVSQWPRNTYVQNAAESASAHSRSVLSEKSKCVLSAEPAKIQRRIRKPIPSRKKRSTTPIRSTPWPNALDSRSYVLNGRVQLFGADKEAMRERIFRRANGRCEEKVVGRKFADGGKWMVRCSNFPTEWSHDRHGANQSDAFDAVIASCGPCHRRRHGQY